MGNLRSNMTDEEWEEAKKKALMTDEERAREQALKDMEEEEDSIEDYLSKTFNDDFYLSYKKKKKDE